MRAARARIPCLLRLFLLALVAGIGYAAWRLGPPLLDFYRAGFFESDPKREYQGTSIDNLKAMRTALLLYHDSEDHFPEAAGWMDAIETRLLTADLSPEEAAKKLRRPGLGETEFGYALNAAVGGKFKDDLPKRGATVLVYESAAIGRNAHGDPAKGLGGVELAITIDGTILRKGETDAALR